MIRSVKIDTVYLFCNLDKPPTSITSDMNYFCSRYNIKKVMIITSMKDNMSRKDRPWASLIRTDDQYYII